MIHFRILIKNQNYGLYAITFSSQGAVTEPVELFTEFNVGAIDIIEQPPSNYFVRNTSDNLEIQSVYSKSGDFLSKVKIFSFFFIKFF